MPPDAPLFPCLSSMGEPLDKHFHPKDLLVEVRRWCTCLEFDESFKHSGSLSLTSAKVFETSGLLTLGTTAVSRTRAC